MVFDYSTTGLPENPRWRQATEVCHAWLLENRSQFDETRIARFMMNRPVAAAKLILAHCPDAPEEFVTLALLGEARGENSGTVPAPVFLAEGIALMNNQIASRTTVDAHHPVRWNIVRKFEKDFADIKGQNPGLDKIFEETLVKSRTALEVLDKPAPKLPRPPSG